jgi:NAD(P)-dependent dehydrogenase (short-subunit alcohol dehydrogenase family)/acyl dehydratase
MNSGAGLTEVRGDRELCFSPDDLELFSSASHDRNPLHTSADYARKTPYGDRVVFGVFGGLACLGGLNGRPDYHLSGVTLDFVNPMFVGVDYTIKITDEDPRRATAKIHDGRLLMLKMTATFAEGRIAEPGGNFQPLAPRREAADPDAASLSAGFMVDGEYGPSPAHLRAIVQRLGLASKGVGAIHVAALMWCSYLVGMEMPGRCALFSRLSLKFAAPQKAPAARLSYQAKVASFDKRFDLLRINAGLSGDGAEVASADLKAFVRQNFSIASEATVESILPRSEALSGKVALVVGASRGLGAGLTQFLARQGAAVLANFHKSRAEAEQLQAALSGAPGEVALLQGDGGNPDVCREMRREIEGRYERLDCLVCNACPPLLPLWLEPHAAHRINEYVGKSLALVSSPMSVFLPALSASGGWCVVISSVIAHRQPPAEWPHYVSAKYAVEGLVRVAAVEYPSVSFLLVRPPGLLTDLTSTPLSRQEAMAPESVAAKVVRRLLGPPSAGRVEVLEDFR